MNKQRLEFWRKHSDRKAVECGNTIKAHDYCNERVFRLTQSYIHRLFEGRTGLRILDVGCGNGLFTAPLARAHHVVGVDVSTNMLRLAKMNRHHPVNSLAEALPFADDSFDVALCIEMFQCVDNGDAIVKEMTRVLKPGGILIVQTLNRSSVIRRAHRLIDAESKLLRMYDLRELIDFADLPELRTPRIIYNYYPLPFRTERDNPSWLSNLVATSFAVVAEKQPQGCSQ